jgi:hypothetical protein
MLTVGMSRLLDRADLLEIDEAKAFMRVSIPATVHSQAALLVESAVAVLREFEAQYSIVNSECGMNSLVRSIFSFAP